MHVKVHVSLPTPSIPCLILFQNQRMTCTDYIKREHDNDMYVHLLEKKNQNITDIRGSSCGYEFFITDPY